MVDTIELSDEEPEETSGGILIVGGKYIQLRTTIYNALFGRVARNPQSLQPKELYIRR